jgi:predicted AlkP superfamily pyrophosphatase or phosphodiesterase
VQAFQPSDDREKSQRITPSIALSISMIMITGVIAGGARAGEETHVRNKVLLIGIDGCRPDALARAKAPQLHELIREGAFSDKAQTGDIPISGPGWASMLTGVWRTKHGVFNNDFVGAQWTQYPHFFRRIKEVQPKAYTASIVHWGPIETRIVAGADLSTQFRKDAKVADEACRLLTEGDPDVLFLQFDEVDAAGHRYGFHPSVDRYRMAIEQTDAYVGRMLQAVRSRKTFSRENWLILASTDHGGADRDHKTNIPANRTIFVIVSGPSAIKGAIEPAPSIVDVAATALIHLCGSIDAKWDLDGKPVGLKPRKREK